MASSGGAVRWDPQLSRYTKDTVDDGLVSNTVLGIAFALPNMFRRFFAEGAFNMAFVPMFSRKLENDDAPRQFAQDAFAGLGGAAERAGPSPRRSSPRSR